MKYPGYLLNPGDMFQVDPEAILLATGKSKKGSSKTSESGDDGEASSKPLAADLWDVVKRTESLLTSIQESNEASSSSTDPPLNKHAARAAENSPSSLSLTDEHRAELGSLVRRAGRAVARRMRAQSTMPPEARNRSAMDDLVDALADLDLGRLPVESRIPEEEEGAEVAPEKVEAAETAAEKPTSDAVAAATEASNEANEPVVKTAANETEAETSAPDSDGAAKADSDAPTSVTTKSTATAEVTPLTPRLLASLRSLVLRALQNPYDPSKPYATPWRPRPYMPAFAFVPRYLEVDPLIGAAVYLRHPVARPGRAEVPTPFPLAQNQLAFNWYLRRR